MEWADVEQAVQALSNLNSRDTQVVSVLCAAYKIGAHPNHIATLTGYPTEFVHDALMELRDKMLIVGKSVAERDILRVLPGAEPLLRGLLLNNIPAIQPVIPAPPTKPITQEVPPMEVKLCDCGRPAKHRGYCKGKGPQQKKPQIAKPAAQDDPHDAVIVIRGKKKVPDVSFSIRCEADGQKYEASGSTLEKFNAAMNVVERMLEA